MAVKRVHINKKKKADINRQTNTDMGTEIIGIVLQLSGNLASSECFCHIWHVYVAAICPHIMRSQLQLVNLSMLTRQPYCCALCRQMCAVSVIPTYICMDAHIFFSLLTFSFIIMM